MQSFTCLVKKEGNQYASVCVELDIASCGHTKKEAIKGLKDAIEAYLEYMISEGRENEIYRPVPKIAQKFDWTRLNHLQLGRYAEYVVKMELALYGFEIYGSEVDDHGIDFVARPAGTSHYFDIQVKSSHGWNYIFI